MAARTYANAADAAAAALATAGTDVDAVLAALALVDPLRQNGALENAYNNFYSFCGL